MHIEKISVYQINLPIAGGEYPLSGGRVWKNLDTSVVRIDTDNGLVGWGETCPCGANYLPAFPGRARAGMEVLAPFLIGKDPRNLTEINMIMDRELYGTPYAKTGLDMACWDLLGKSTGLPAYTLMGGRLIDVLPFTGFFSLDPGPKTVELIKKFHEHDCKLFEFKGTGDPAVDIEMIRFVGEQMKEGDTVKIDANGGWKIHEALYVEEAVRGIHVLFEQPCWTYEECLSFKQSTGRPMALDECVSDIPSLLRAHKDNSIDVYNLKLSKVGGVTKSRQMRDLCTSLGIPFIIQDSAGGDFVAGAIAHLAHSTQPGYLLSTWDSTEMVTQSIGKGLLRDHLHQARATSQPGFGVDPLLNVLGEPEVIYEN